MKRIFLIALAAGVASAFVLLAATTAEAKCSKASATGLGVTEDMAKELAKMNLDSGIASKGMKAKGKISYKCDFPILTECTASRRAC